MTIDLDKEQVRFQLKKGEKFDAAQLEKAFTEVKFSRVRVLSAPDSGDGKANAEK